MRSANMNHRQYRGYRKPSHDEVCSERRFLETLVQPGADFVPIGRQLRVFGSEKLDLLALDRWAQPWIFEFDRSSADPKSIAKLLCYSSYVARWTRAELVGKYGGDDTRPNLERAFHSRFGSKLPRKLANGVKLVLAAYDFSQTCQQALDFLEESCSIVIGQLKINGIWDRRAEACVEYEWLRRPMPASRIKVERHPDSYYTLAQDINALPLEWVDCVDNGLLPIPMGEISFHVPRNSGVFVHLRDEPSDDEQPYSGWVGYGVTTDVAFDLSLQGDRVRLTNRSYRRLRMQQDAPWVIPIKWLKTHRDGTLAKSSIFPHPGFNQVTEQSFLLAHAEDLDLELSDPRLDNHA